MFLFLRCVFDFITNLYDVIFQILQKLINKDKEENQGDVHHFLSGPNINVSIRRNYIYEDAFEKLSPENGIIFVFGSVLQSAFDMFFMTVKLKSNIHLHGKKMYKSTTYFL